MVCGQGVQVLFLELMGCWELRVNLLSPTLSLDPTIQLRIAHWSFAMVSRAKLDSHRAEGV